MNILDFIGKYYDEYLDDYKNDELVPILCGESGVVLKKIG